MAKVIIGDQQHEIPEQVSKWIDWANKTLQQTNKMRTAQKHYFAYRNNLAQCKSMEKAVDDLLEGKTPQVVQAAQAELFR